MVRSASSPQWGLWVVRDPGVGWASQAVRCTGRKSEVRRSEIERAALKSHPDAELEELTGIYINRGLTPETAREVARQLTEHDALEAHARDELGMSDAVAARPVQAAFSSAASFTIGAILPILAALFAPAGLITPVVAVVSLISLAILGALSARAGGASKLKAASRVVFWGVAAMLVTGVIGHLFGTVV